tara:strand:+ start:2615 stop:2878 length:264 start_codon:yes stop_codon:yes gene_type:complete
MIELNGLITIFTLISIVGGAGWKISTVLNSLKNTIDIFSARMEEKMINVEKHLQQQEKLEDKIGCLTQRVVKLETWIKRQTSTHLPS